MTANAHSAPWLAIVGIGEDGLDGLGATARRLIGEAEFVFGGARHLALAANAITGERRPWPSPFDPAMAAVLEQRGRKVCVLASGDPFLYGVGATLARLVPRAEMQVVPGPSAFSLAASRLGWALQELETVSLHGRPLELLLPLLHPRARILALTSDGNAPAAIAALLGERGFGASRLTVIEALGGLKERVRSTQAEGFDLTEINPLNVLAIEVESTREAQVLPLTSGMDDGLFENDGQLTKREIRAVTLSALAPRRGELLWDIGAGAGSVAIEWMLRHPSMRAIAIESDPERANRIGRNANACGVPGLGIVTGEAPGALEGLEPPDAVFVGGGGSEPGVMETAMAALKSGGRLVANAVTLEMEQVLLALQAAHGGRLIRLAVSRAVPVGTMQGWRAAMPVTQWTWESP